MSREVPRFRTFGGQAVSLERRRFLAHAAGIMAGPLSCHGAPGRDSHPDDGPRSCSGPRFSADEVVTVQVASGGELQHALNRHAGTGRCVRVGRPGPLVCGVREDAAGDEKSTHALLVPGGVQLDLNGSTLHLDLRSNSYGVRLASDSAIRNGTIRLVRSVGKGSQACWHSGVSIGAAYGDGGTPGKPGRFSSVRHWAIENMTIDQPFAAAAIQLMSEACYGVIKNVRILDSHKALMGIGLDWGTVGPITTVDAEIPRMR